MTPIECVELLQRELKRLYRQVEALTNGQRLATKARQQAFLELAEELMPMSAEERESTLRRIIDQNN